MSLVGLQLLTSFWGDKHLEYFRSACLRSLAWPKNKTALEDAEWNIFTDEKYFDNISLSIAAALPRVKIKLGSTSDLRDYTDNNQSAVIKTIDKCLKLNERLLIAPPDTIFGDGSISNLLMAGREKHSCVVSPHPRVLPNILASLTASPLTNQELLDLAWKNLHRSWSEAEDGHPRQSSYVGGVEWKRNGNIIHVTHRLPTPYLCDFTEEDLQYFKGQISFGGFDHKWSGDILIHRGRQRYLGSSDAAFICEVTEGDRNIPPIMAGAPTKGFWREWPHNKANAQVTGIFRLPDEYVHENPQETLAA